MKFAFSSLTFLALASSASAAKGGPKGMTKKGVMGKRQKKSKATRSVSIQANEEYQKHYLVS
jgi:hypothetical protein